MNLEQKQSVVEEVKALVNSAQAMFLLTCEGLGVADSTRLRRELGKEGALLRVVKNTLLARALEGSPVPFLGEMLKGQLALAYTVKDPVALAKALTAFAKTNTKVQVVGGSLGVRAVKQADVKALAALPTPEVLKAMLLGALVGVPKKFLGLLQAPARDFVYLLKARETDLAKQG